MSFLLMRLRGSRSYEKANVLGGVLGMMILVTKWFGVFLCDKERVVKKVLFEKDPNSMATRLARIQAGEVLEEERALAKEKVQVAEQRLSPLGKPMVYDSSFIRPEDFSYDRELMHEVMIELGRLRTREPIPKDRSIVQAIRSLDDVNEMINIMNERLHEWYGLHFPELADHAKDSTYAELIARHGRREGVIEELSLDVESVGSELEEDDLEAVGTIASHLSSLYSIKEGMERYLEENVSREAPNLSTLVSENLAARLISLAGGLERLSRLPASTVQLLGAEKAMFRHLKGKKRPPKHGIIFQHPAVHRAPYWQRGNISRALAAKISIAAKVDNWKGEYIGDRLLSQFEARVEEIEKKYPEPPKKRRK
jgi:nucleolar protein 56